MELILASGECNAADEIICVPESVSVLVPLAPALMVALPLSVTVSLPLSPLSMTD